MGRWQIVSGDNGDNVAGTEVISVEFFEVFLRFGFMDWNCCLVT